MDRSAGNPVVQQFREAVLARLGAYLAYMEPSTIDHLDLPSARLLTATTILPEAVAATAALAELPLTQREAAAGHGPGALTLLALIAHQRGREHSELLTRCFRLLEERFGNPVLCSVVYLEGWSPAEPAIESHLDDTGRRVHCSAVAWNPALEALLAVPG